MKAAPIIVGILVIITLQSCNRPPIEKDTISTASPLEQLMEGNRRFMSGHPVHPNETLDRLRKLKRGQDPMAVVVSCSDSRVPPELVFDQGLGNIFSIRTAGNVIGDYELGSIEYAVEHLGVSLVLVMGHENCGAVDAYMHQDKEKHLNHIQKLVDYINDEAEEQQLPESLKNNIQYTVSANVQHAVNLLRASDPILHKLWADGELIIVGAVYDLDSGEARLINE